MWEEKKYNNIGGARRVALLPVHRPLLPLLPFVSVEYQGSLIRLDWHALSVQHDDESCEPDTFLSFSSFFSLVVAPKANKKATADNINSKLALVMKSGKVTLGLKVSIIAKSAHT